MFEKFLSNPYHRVITLLIRRNITDNDRKEASQILKSIDIDELYRVSYNNEVASIMYPELVQILGHKLDKKWESEYLTIKNRISWMMGVFKQLSDELNKANIPIVALKNSGIALGLLDDFGLSPMGDIDTLIKKEDMKQAHEIAQKMGFAFKFRSVYEKEDFDNALAHGSTEYSYNDNTGQNMWFEMSWRPIDGRWINQAVEPKAETLIKSSVLIPNTNVRILSPEDNLLQVSIHTAKHSYIRKPGFRLHLDVDRVVSENDINWDDFLKKVYSVNTKTAVYFSLKSAKSLFNTNIPESVLNELKPNKLKGDYIRRKIEKMDLFKEDSSAFTRMEFLLFQSALYDNIMDIVAVAFPGIKFLKRKYSDTSIFYAQVLHLFDLVGVRKKK
ncbi:nucleotidyltransferase domain-containing protein [Pradoshia eiseniae]|nr:nucleotidyltransferase family protein [Pradoshia eiseniae]